MRRGGAEFTASFKALVKEIAGGAELLPLARDHALYQGAFAEGVDFAALAQEEDTARAIFRPYALLKEGRMDGPRLLAVMLRGRAAILFSPEDFTSGLLGTNTWGIVGYTPESAEKLVRNILLYVTEPPATTVPATIPATAPATAPATVPASTPAATRATQEK